MLVSFKYERLPNFCYLCGVLGHIMADCELKYESNAELDSFPYGDWHRETVSKTGQFIGQRFSDKGWRGNSAASHGGRSSHGNRDFFGQNKQRDFEASWRHAPAESVQSTERTTTAPYFRPQHSDEVHVKRDHGDIIMKDRVVDREESVVGIEQIFGRIVQDLDESEAAFRGQFSSVAVATAVETDLRVTREGQNIGRRVVRRTGIKNSGMIIRTARAGHKRLFHHEKDTEGNRERGFDGKH